MKRTHIRGGLVALATTLLIAVLLAVVGSAPEAAQPTPKRTEVKPVAQPANLVGLEIELGRNDKEPADWNGDVQVSAGRVLDLSIARGGPKNRAEGNRFFARSIRQAAKKGGDVVGPIVRVSLDAPPTAKVTVKTDQGTFAFDLKDLPDEKPKLFLESRAAVERQEGSVRVTSQDTEEDFPALARGKDGTAWLAFVEYRPGRPYVLERVLAGGFDDLVPKGHGDQILLSRFDGKTWQPPVEVTGPGLDVHRPAVAVDGKGNVCVAWSQQIDGDWEIFYRSYAPANDRWSPIARMTTSPGSDHHVVATTDAAGTVWLAWQGWRGGNFDILVTILGDGQISAKPQAISTSKANDWSPAIAADTKGNVYVAYDTYDRGDYDVQLRRLGKEPGNWIIADSARYEARPSVLCDAQDRVWIAYEEGDEQWGKDFATGQFKRIPLEKNLGFGLYNNRTLRVKCLAEGRLQQPAAELSDPEKAARRKSLPRLASDSANGVWLFYRQHPRPGVQGGGEVWSSYATRFDGRNWSAPRQLSASGNLLDNRPALLSHGAGVLAVYSGDNRVRSLNRGQNDLLATIVTAAAPTQPPALVAAAAAPPSTLAPVHANEAADVARMRDARVNVAGKELRLFRGEFHRHTEFSSHGDIDGLLEDSWRYALDAGNLDWMGNGDHDSGFHHEYLWWLIQKTTDLYQLPGRFIAAHTHERSVVYPNGHRNVMMPRRGIRPLPRGDMNGSAEKGTPDTKIVYAYLKHFGGICASHTSGTDMGTDWRDNDPVAEPIVEIYQGHRHNYEHSGAPRSANADTHIGGYRPAGYVWNAFEKGYRFGFQASSDHQSTHISYAIVLTDDFTRPGIIATFKRRHCYAATDNIYLVVRSDDHLMGDAFETAKRPSVSVNVRGTGPIAKLHIIKNNKYVYSTEPKTQEVRGLRDTDMEARPGETSYYYVRVEQADGNLAWGSPMWVTYRP